MWQKWISITPWRQKYPYREQCIDVGVSDGVSKNEITNFLRDNWKNILMFALLSSHIPLDIFTTV